MQNNNQDEIDAYEAEMKGAAEAEAEARAEYDAENIAEAEAENARIVSEGGEHE